ncbi:Uncharacterised protein [Mycobacteroides abscessus subsp. abscessus]|nr:Uncharacterised protein [Mycobacteroides abscessus subsp. abscessus]SIF47569.1 Uncharacterised protein [Mycobacteroides abscessus subsp. abscessus]SIL26186.1 Uncharacterised protein [Mycobacteroides abscessus subsp. abscessus]
MRLLKISSVTCPPPASSDQWPAFAAAATILASTVVGVMPAKRIGERPVRRVNLVDSLTEPSGSDTTVGAKEVHARATSGTAPCMKRFRCPPRVAVGTIPIPRPRMTGAVSRVSRSPGPRSRIQRAPASATWFTSFTQSTGVTRMASVKDLVSSTSRPAAAAQRPAISTPSARRGVWKPTSTSTGSNTGLKIAPPRTLSLRSAASRSAICSQYSSNRDNCSGVPVITTERRPLRMDSAGG